VPRARFIAGLGVFTLLVASAAALGRSPSTTLEVMAELGPLDGWRCLHEISYVYEPRWPHFDRGLLAESPESMLRDVDVERVELALRTGEAVVWARAGERQRVYVLEPGRLQLTGPGCVAHLADWRITGEHAID
jgi:hypothetical protein